MGKVSEKYICEVTAAANKSTMAVRVGAILIHRNKIISVGYNRLKFGYNSKKYGLL